jgi:hypothetical protein
MFASGPSASFLQGMKQRCMEMMVFPSREEGHQKRILRETASVPSSRTSLVGMQILQRQEK